jgi:hypothetical protein
VGVYLQDAGQHHQQARAGQGKAYFLFHPLHRIFGCMHKALNVGKKDN